MPVDTAFMNTTSRTSDKPRRRSPLLTLVGASLLAFSCLPPRGEQTVSDSNSDNVGNLVDASTPEGDHCHSGIFECADGEIVTACGTWYFDMNESGAVVGAGEITGGFPDVPIEITLSGVIDEGVEAYEIVLASTGGGTGLISLTYPGPTLDLSGSWSFTNAPEPDGVEISGGVTGTSCTALP